MIEQSVSELASQVRSYINDQRKKYELRQNSGLFSQLASSLDVIDDTEWAGAGFGSGQLGDSTGGLYLAIYGLLQAIFMQQDAVENLCESLGIPEKIKSYPHLFEIRELRNDSVGHPTKRDADRKKRRTSYLHISQMTMSRKGFDLISYFSDSTPTRFQTVDISALIADQRTYIAEILGKVVFQLNAEDKAHKAKFRMEKLRLIFPNSLDYNLEKVQESIFETKLAKFGAGNLASINGVIENFRQAVGKRNMELANSLQGDYELIEHAVGLMNSFFDSRQGTEASPAEILSARVWLHFIRTKIDDLKELAEEVDEDYMNDQDTDI